MKENWCHKKLRHPKIEIVENMLDTRSVVHIDHITINDIICFSCVYD